MKVCEFEGQAGVSDYIYKSFTTLVVSTKITIGRSTCLLFMSLSLNQCLNIQKIKKKQQNPQHDIYLQTK
jgi:hypothetical protein